MRILHALAFFFTASTASAHAQTPAAGVITVDPTITCEQATSEMQRDPATVDPADRDIFRAVQAKCDAQAWNAVNPDKQVAVVGAYDAAEKRMLFNSIRVSDGEKVRAACKVGVSIITANEFTGDPVTGAVAGTLGNYGCGAYFRAAVDNNPLLIFFPTYVPGYQLQKDVWREIRKAISVIPDREIGGVIPGTKIPLFIVAPQVAILLASSAPLENIRRETDRAIQNTGRTVGQVGRDLGNAPGRVFNQACYSVCRARGSSRRRCRNRCD